MNVPPLKERRWYDSPINTYNPWEDKINPNGCRSLQKDSLLDPDVSLLSISESPCRPINPRINKQNPFIEEDLGLILEKFDNLTIKDSERSYTSCFFILTLFCALFYYLQEIAFKIALYSIILCVVTLFIDLLGRPRKALRLTERQNSIKKMSRMYSP
eukprot:NODE_560_length_6681_cov_0.715740.p3 type:complete len:158 gc:universal NODE_560_length_6681_cov_0.715740:4404-3931(-)